MQGGLQVSRKSRIVDRKSHIIPARLSDLRSEIYDLRLVRGNQKALHPQGTKDMILVVPPYFRRVCDALRIPGSAV